VLSSWLSLESVDNVNAAIFFPLIYSIQDHHKLTVSAQKHEHFKNVKASCIIITKKGLLTVGANDLICFTARNDEFLRFRKEDISLRDFELSDDHNSSKPFFLHRINKRLFDSIKDYYTDKQDDCMKTRNNQVEARKPDPHLGNLPGRSQMIGILG
jgi:hypothetical protein